MSSQIGCGRGNSSPVEASEEIRGVVWNTDGQTGKLQARVLASHFIKENLCLSLLQVREFFIIFFSGVEEHFPDRPSQGQHGRVYVRRGGHFHGQEPEWLA